MVLVFWGSSGSESFEIIILRTVSLTGRATAIEFVRKTFSERVEIVEVRINGLAQSCT